MANLAIWDRAEQDIQGLIQGLNLTCADGSTGNIGDNVYVQSIWDQLNIQTWPCVLVSAQDVQEQELESDFEEDWVAYPVVVLICDQQQVDFQSTRGTYLSWRQQIAQMLRDRERVVPQPVLLPTTPECSRIVVEDGPNLPADCPVLAFVYSSLTAMLWTNTGAR
jgi:hypothetical protein